MTPKLQALITKWEAELVTLEEGVVDADYSGSRSPIPYSNRDTHKRKLNELKEAAE